MRRRSTATPPASKSNLKTTPWARLFYETLSRAPDHHSQTESKTEVSIPIVFDHKQKVVDGPSRKFNEAVAICDSNKDGRITELEAKIYAEQKYWK